MITLGEISFDNDWIKAKTIVSSSDPSRPESLTKLSNLINFAFVR